MKQENQQLLLQDLNARLLYKVKVTTTNAAVKFGVISGVSIENKISVSTKHADIVFNCTEVKPYLFPLSSMTEEQKAELELICGERIGFNDGTFIDFSGYGEVPLKYVNDVIDWLNRNHFDYRGLIEKGLALNAAGLNIY